MSKFESFDDMFSFNRCMMEDDWNDGQMLVVKDKRKVLDQDYATTLKVGEAKDGKQKVALEQKIKFKGPELGGYEKEAKFKSNGTISYEAKSLVLKVSNRYKINLNVYFYIGSSWC